MASQSHLVVCQRFAIVLCHDKSKQEIERILHPKLGLLLLCKRRATCPRYTHPRTPQPSDEIDLQPLSTPTHCDSYTKIQVRGNPLLDPDHISKTHLSHVRCPCWLICWRAWDAWRPRVGLAPVELASSHSLTHITCLSCSFGILFVHVALHATEE